MSDESMGRVSGRLNSCFQYALAQFFYDDPRRVRVQFGTKCDHDRAAKPIVPRPRERKSATRIIGPLRNLKDIL